MNVRLTPEEKFEVFGDFDPDEHAAEVEERWGHTEAYKESQRRTAAYTKEDWKRVTVGLDAIHRKMADLLAQGVAADSAAAMDVAEEHRQFICGAYYDCPPEMHTCLGEMYVTDERFTATYEAIRPGLAVYMRDAILANAVRHQ